jgi:hypothetical protein
VAKSKLTMAALALNFAAATSAAMLQSKPDRTKARLAAVAAAIRRREQGITDAQPSISLSDSDEDKVSSSPGAGLLLLRAKASQARITPRHTTKVKGRAASTSGAPLKPGWLVTHPEASSGTPSNEATGSQGMNFSHSARCIPVKSSQTQPLISVFTMRGDASCTARVGGHHAGEGGVSESPCPIEPGRIPLPEVRVEHIEQNRPYNEGFQFRGDLKPEPTDSPPP